MNLFSTAPNKNEMSVGIDFARIEANNHRCQELQMAALFPREHAMRWLSGYLFGEKRKVDLLECGCQSRGASDAGADTPALFDNRKE